MRATKPKYAIKAFGLGTFPKFYDSFPNMKSVDEWLKMIKEDGFISAEIYKDLPRKPSYFGIERELIKTIYF